MAVLHIRDGEVNLKVGGGAKSRLVAETAKVLLYNAPVYDGEYVITPKAEEAQVLATKNRVLEDNVTVEKVPSFDVSNLSGGRTFYIAAEVE